MSLFGLVVILLVAPLAIFFKWFYRKFPWIEENPLKTWGIVMLLVFVLAILVS